MREIAASLEATNTTELEVFGEIPIEKLSKAAYTTLLAGYQLFQRFFDALPGSRQEDWRKHLRHLQALVRTLRNEQPTENALAQAGLQDAKIDPAHVQAFAERVVRAREAIGLSQRELAERSGLSARTIVNIENGKRAPAQETILRLLMVRELGIGLKEVPWRVVARPEVGSLPNCWIAPGYESLKMFADLIEVVNGPGGKVEQTMMYLDHRSAEDWRELTQQSAYVTKYRDRVPLGTIAQTILADTSHLRLDVIALGAGDGRLETRLMEHLLDGSQAQHKPTDLRFYLLDVSQPLLIEAYQHAAKQVGLRGASVTAIQGNFHQWPRFTQFHYTSEVAHRRRIVTMLGLTMGNLENDANFFQQTLIGLNPGDLLLLDVLMAPEGVDRPEDIQRTDLALRDGPSAAHKKLLSGPFHRYCENLKAIELRYALSPFGTVMGKYAIDMVAEVELRDGQRRTFSSLFRYTRYDTALLASIMRSIGWELLTSAHFGQDHGKPSNAIMLFKLTRPLQATVAAERGA